MHEPTATEHASRSALAKRTRDSDRDGDVDANDLEERDFEMISHHNSIWSLPRAFLVDAPVRHP